MSTPGQKFLILGFACFFVIAVIAWRINNRKIVRPNIPPGVMLGAGTDGKIYCTFGDKTWEAKPTRDGWQCRIEDIP